MWGILDIWAVTNKSGFGDWASGAVFWQQQQTLHPQLS
jgi:hypothetical protein